jgi:hypothetical protein
VCVWLRKKGKKTTNFLSFKSPFPFCSLQKKRKVRPKRKDKDTYVICCM